MNPNYVGEKQAIDLIKGFNNPDIEQKVLLPNEEKGTNPVVILAEKHTEEIECIAVFPGGKYFVSVGDDYTIKVFNSDGTLFTSIKNEHKDVISSVVVMNDFKFATCSWDKTIKVWKIKGKTFICECTRTFELDNTTTGEGADDDKDDQNVIVLDPKMNDFQQILFYEFWDKKDDKGKNIKDELKKDAFITASLTAFHNINPITIFSIGYDQTSSMSQGNKHPKVSTIDKSDEVMKTHDDKIQSIFKFNENTIISSGLDKKLKIWTIQNDPLIFIRDDTNPKVDVIDDVEPAYYQGGIAKIDANRIIVGSERKIQIINVSSKNKTNKFVNDKAYNMLLLNSGLLLVTDQTENIRLYTSENLNKICDIHPKEPKIEENEEKKEEKLETEGYQCIVQLKDGSIITSNHGTIKIWSF
jgi:WD40 repeat protein